MTFNPILQDGIAFEQPVAPTTSGVEAIGSVIGNLGLFNRPSAPADNAQTRYNNSITTFSQATGASSSPSEWTSRQHQEFARFDPFHADRALDTAEARGFDEFSQVRDQQEAFSNWANSPDGVSAATRLAYEYRDDPDSLSRGMQFAYLEFQELEAQRADLQRRASDASNRDTIQDEIWDVEGIVLSDRANALGSELASMYDELRLQGSFMLSNRHPLLAQLMGGDVEVRSDNIGLIAGQLSNNLTSSFVRELSGAYPEANIRALSSEQRNSLLFGLNNVVEQIQQGTDPSSVLQQQTDQDMIRIRRTLESEGLGNLWPLFDLFQNNPTMMASLEANLNISQRLQDALIDSFNSSGNPITLDADRMSVEEAEDFIELSGDMFSSLNSNSSQAEIDTITSWIGALPEVAQRAGVVLGENTYSDMFDPQVVGAMGNNLDALGRFAMSDMSMEVSNLTQIAESENLQISFENGQVSLVGENRVSDDGLSLGARELTQSQQRILDRVNSKLQILQSSQFGQDIVTNLADGFEPNQTENTDLPNEALRQSSASQPATVAQGSNLVVAQVRDGLMHRGIPPHVVEGFLMNIQDESSFNSGLNEAAPIVPGSRGGFGLIQWTGPRRVELEQYAQSRGEGVDNIDVQLDFLVRELQTSESGAAQAILSTSTPQEAAVAILNEFLRPAEEHRSRRELSYLGAQPLPYDSSVDAGLFEAPQGATQVHDYAWATPGMSPLFSAEGASGMTQPYAVERMQTVLDGPFRRMQELFGSPITINDAIAKEGTTRESNTPGSRHFHGDALDVDISGMSNDELVNLVRSAMEAGFQGFGFGSGLLHIDLGARRAWNYGNDTFAGRPVTEWIEMVRNNTIPRAELVASAQEGQFPHITEETRAALFDQPESIVASLSGLETDDELGEPTNVTNFDTEEELRQILDQVSGNNDESASSAENQRRATNPVDEEIQSLVESLTNMTSQRGLSNEDLMQYIMGTLGND